ncbi:hypothetical protein H920_12814 [Fukomys damarensis]|uniref:Uncharacterized protein n=1 Tax=Fukomys damarensis TaxID=885580 RepID=A0A091D5B6_FUKDA|nr:hypothetical protein H920_12814 [Fukomys damarensis]
MKTRPLHGLQSPAPACSHRFWKQCLSPSGTHWPSDSTNSDKEMMKAQPQSHPRVSRTCGTHAKSPSSSPSPRLAPASRIADSKPPKSQVPGSAEAGAPVPTANQPLRDPETKPATSEELQRAAKTGTSGRKTSARTGRRTRSKGPEEPLYKSHDP